MESTIQLQETSNDPISSFPRLYAEAPEEALLIASRAGDGRAFAELCRRHGQVLRNKVMRIVRQREDAEDVVQETMLRAFRNLSSFRGTCKFQTWLIRIGINSSLMLLRKRQARSKSIVDPAPGFSDWSDGALVPSTGLNPEQEYFKMRARLVVAQAVTRLREDYRCLLERHYRDGCSVSDIATDLGISTASAKSRIHRARRLLRERLKGQFSPA